MNKKRGRDDDDTFYATRKIRAPAHTTSIFMTAPGDVFPGDKSWEKDTTKRFLGKPLSNNGKGLLGTHAKVFITLLCFFLSDHQ